MNTSDKLIIAMIQAIDKKISVVDTKTRNTTWGKK
jgi:hypothetical protein